MEHLRNILNVQAHRAKMTLELCKARIMIAIRRGNHETKYIHECVTRNNHGEYTFVMGEALQQLVREGAIRYDEILEGYYLVKNEDSK